MLGGSTEQCGESGKVWSRQGRCGLGQEGVVWASWKSLQWKRIFNYRKKTL